MIPQSIIDKYGLVKTDMQNGESFIYNVSIYRMDQEEYKLILISDGDMQGHPLPNNQLMIYIHHGNQWRSGRIAIEMLQDISFPLIKFIKSMVI